jgi:hypothetical protein
MIHVALIAVIAGAVFAEPAPQSTAQSAKASSAAESATEKKVCRRIVVTGSITPKRTCQTQAEWNAQAKANEDSVRQMQDDSRRMGGN